MDADLYDAEARMSLADALRACRILDVSQLDGERTLYDSQGQSIVSYWPTTDGGIDARWHRREECPDMDGDITCDDGCATPAAYYSTMTSHEVANFRPRRRRARDAQ